MSEIVTVAERLLPLIRELRHTTEDDRRIAEPIVQEIRESGLCRMLLDTGAPPRYTPDEWLRALETLAGAEASVSWLVWNSALAGLRARFLGAAGRARLFGDARRLCAGSTRPTGRAVPIGGGLRLSGRWALVSGCELADGVHLMGPVHEDGGPRLRSPTSACASCPRAATTSSPPGTPGAYGAPGATTSSWTTGSCRRKTRARPPPRRPAPHRWPGSPSSR
jgi:alkylation response protein AidB-like acyl-CoA dehydrogenase